jgi:hypothetical protein
MASASAQQASVESQRWLVPIQAESGCCGGRVLPGAVQIYNMNGHAVYVQVLRYAAQGQLRASPQVTVAAGGAASEPLTTSDTSGYLVVLASEPVMVTGYVIRNTTVSSQWVPNAGSNPGLITLDQKTGVLGTWNYYLRQDVSALPVGCAGAAGDHFICSRALPRQDVTAGTTGPRPTVAQPAQPTPAPTPTRPVIQRERERTTAPR